MQTALEDLDNAVIAAHAAHNGAALAYLYGEAADGFAAEGNIDTACFFYTQAYIFALEQGLPEAVRYEELLKENARL